MKKIAFIINPISGVNKKMNLPRLIQEHVNHSKFQFELFYTEYRGHACAISEKIVSENSFDIIGIVGGDGSVNEVGRILVNTSISLAIIPAGSGNGFARHFEIPCNIVQALNYLNDSEIYKVDTGKINDHHFFATCGLGFDARVTHRFDELEKRGFMGYVKAIYQEIRKCQDIDFLIEGINSRTELNSFVLTIANTSQYGNEFTISPNSKANDGNLELIAIPKPKWFELPEFLFKSFRKNLLTYKKWEEFKGDEFVVVCNNRKGHVDGDPILLEKKNYIKVLPNSLQLMLKK